VSRVERQRRLTVEQYLAFENYAESRHECVDGVVYELPGESVAHSIVKDNVIDALRRHLRTSPLRVYSTAMKLRVGDAFYYPDIIVAVTGSPESHYLTEPWVIVEIASLASEQRDMLEKAVAYRGLPSIREYAVISDRERRVVVYHRKPTGWEEEVYGKGEVIRFESLGLSLPTSELYAELLT
jgi:Uma2 family endonuclease